jgi:hypothetical protein
MGAPGPTQLVRELIEELTELTEVPGQITRSYGTPSLVEVQRRIEQWLAKAGSRHPNAPPRRHRVRRRVVSGATARAFPSAVAATRTVVARQSGAGLWRCCRMPAPARGQADTVLGCVGEMPERHALHPRDASRVDGQESHQLDALGSKIVDGPAHRLTSPLLRRRRDVRADVRRARP